MSGLLLFSIACNIWLVSILVRKSDECKSYKEKASFWLTKYNEK